MSAQRLKGQECQILIVRDGALENSLVDIQNFNLESQFELKEQGYLGEKTNRKDEIYNGCGGDLDLHLHTQEWFRFLLAIKDRAQRITPDTLFNITAVLFYPDGSTPSVLISDVKFGSSPLSIASRGDYVSVKLSYGAEDFVVTFS